MNRRLIITIGVLVFISIGVFVGVKEYLSYKSVSIVFKQPSLSIDIYGQNDTVITSSLSKDTTLQLKNGSYYYIPVESTFNGSKVYFSVEDTSEVVEISPSYSSSKLRDLLKQSSMEIQKTLTRAYPLVITNYIIGDERLEHYGEWYSAKLIQKVGGGNQPDVYRLVMKQDNDIWKIIVSPRLIVSKEDYPALPEYVIDHVNEPLSNEAYAQLYPE